MKKISDFISKYMAVIVLAVAALALFVPGTCLWIDTGWINYLLMIVMFGMGLTMKTEDFAVLFTKPRDMVIGCLAQFLIMPALAFGLGKAFGLNEELLVGVILVGTCPGGTSSNVITYLSKGDTALSIGMTSINTLLALAPDNVMRYIVIHELCHLKHMDHSKSFKELLYLYCPDHEVCDKWLSTEGVVLSRRLRESIVNKNGDVKKGGTAKKEKKH